MYVITLTFNSKRAKIVSLNSKIRKSRIIVIFREYTLKRNKMARNQLEKYLNQLNIKKGEAFLVTADVEFGIIARNKSLLYKAFVPETES